MVNVYLIKETVATVWFSQKQTFPELHYTFRHLPKANQCTLRPFSLANELSMGLKLHGAKLYSLKCSMISNGYRLG